MSLTIPPIKDSNLRKFCQEHPLDITLATVYQYARKCYPTAVNMGFSLSESYYGDSDDSYIVFRDFVCPEAQPTIPKYIKVYFMRVCLKRERVGKI